MSSRSSSTLLLTASLLIIAPINGQYFITADDSYCLAIGTNSLTNISQLFWCDSSYSSNCINWKLEQHFNRETQSFYNGKFNVNGIGANAINQESYLGHRMYADGTDFHFTKGQSKLPSAQRGAAVGYDSTNNIIELVGGYPDGYLHVEYAIESDTFYSFSNRFNQYQKCFGQSYRQIGDILYTGNAYKFDVVTEAYTSFSEPGGTAPDWRFGCLVAFDSNNYIFFVEDGLETRVYDIQRDTSFVSPPLQRTHSRCSCQIANDYLYVMGGTNSWVEKLFIDPNVNVSDTTINAYSFEYLTDRLSGRLSSRSMVIGNNILIQTFDSSIIDVLDTVTDRISRIGTLLSSYRYPGSILLHNIWYLFGGAVESGNDLDDMSDDWFFYDLSADTDVNINDDIIANGMDEFELDLNANTLINNKYGSVSIPCALGMSANGTLFVLDDNTTINGYSARFDCSDSGSVTSHSIDIAYQSSVAPTDAPSIAPSEFPSNAPTFSPTLAPSNAPSEIPTNAPSLTPSVSPTHVPSAMPSNVPSKSPTQQSRHPTIDPTPSPTRTRAPNVAPSSNPTLAPSIVPTNAPSAAPTVTVPTMAPTREPTIPLCHDAKYQEIMKYSSKKGQNDFLFGGQSLVSANCRFLLMMKKNGNLIIYRTVDETEWNEGWHTNTSIYNRSGESVCKLVLRESALQIMEYVYQNVPSFKPIKLWDSKQTSMHRGIGSRYSNDLRLTLTDTACILLNASQHNENVVLWSVCSTFNNESNMISTTNEGSRKSEGDKAKWIMWTAIVVSALVGIAILFIISKFCCNKSGFKSDVAQPSFDSSDNEDEANEGNQRTTVQINQWLYETAMGDVGEKGEDQTRVELQENVSFLTL